MLCCVSMIPRDNMSLVPLASTSMERQDRILKGHPMNEHDVQESPELAGQSLHCLCVSEMVLQPEG